jgi:signal transduction histidine kinase
VDRFSSTLSGLAAPRRSIPIALGAAALVVVQAMYHADPRALAVPVVLVGLFTLLAPWSWRAVANHRLRVLVLAALAVAAVAVACVALPAALGLGPTYLTDPGALVIEGVLFVIGGAGLGRDLELELELEHGRLKAIQAHLDPHFLYNTLNAIAEWCAEDPRVAEEATLRLASLLRDVMEGLALREWPLAREQAVVEDLLELHRIRDVDAFTTEITVDEHAREIAVLPLIVVTLVENALKHGPRKGHRGAITVRAAATTAGLHVEVENPNALARDAREGHGLAMVRKRLALAYAGRATFAIRAIEGRTRASLELPRSLA